MASDGIALRRWGCVRPVAVVVGVVCAASAGCGPRGLSRVPVVGVVTFRGAPVPAGEIRFEPDAARGHRGPVGHAVIENGKYSTAAEGCQGPLAGPLVVWINARRAFDPARELQEPLFSEYSTRIDLVAPRPGRSVALDFDVPESAGPPRGLRGGRPVSAR